MSQLSSKFNNGHKALIGYLTVGYPDIETTVRAATVLETPAAISSNWESLSLTPSVTAL